ncbi:MAG: Cytosolic iron-sulfur protein assembly protein [Vezdaea aestivalis]|nr:MAG: Cytosolic iron-sulfur protein assembly protein [Vezdaea aestivalis]
MSTVSKDNAPPPPIRPLQLSLLSALTPPTLTRAWHSSPHPSLPLLASTSDKSVRIYSLLNFRQHSLIEGGHKRSVRATAWKPGTAGTGESVLATGSFDASAGIWRRYEKGVRNEEDEDEDEEWNFSVVLDGHESEIKSLAWSAGGNYLATCSRDKSVWIWEELDADEFETVAVLQDHEADVKCVVWHPEEELLASSSYDDSVRLYKEDMDDWTCVGLLNGHNSTVWSIDFEPVEIGLKGEEERGKWVERRKASGPRLASASADGVVKIWRRVPKEGQVTGTKKITSVIRSSSAEEEWVVESTLPTIHEREIYSVAWSSRSGLIATTGGDGRIVVFGEQWRDMTDVVMSDDAMEAPEATEWVVMGEIESAHGVFEVNHITWSRRWDRERVSEAEEILVSTGDDGEVKVWKIDNQSGP